MKNSFIWTDLSSYDPLKSIEFYQTTFDWEIVEEEQYYVAYKDGLEVVGLYETPSFFKKIKMPHFWMNYIQVEDLATIVKQVRKLGGKVEIEKAAFYGGYIALIRDPMGAGFTLYQGEKLYQRSSNSHGAVIHRELHTSDANLVIPFYQELFHWTFIQSGGEGKYDIYTNNHLKIASLLGIDNALKGKYEYWVTTFGVTDLSATKDKVLLLGGTEISNEGNRILCADYSGEAFFYVEEISVWT